MKWYIILISCLLLSCKSSRLNEKTAEEAQSENDSVLASPSKDSQDVDSVVSEVAIPEGLDQVYSFCAQPALNNEEPKLFFDVDSVTSSPIDFAVLNSPSNGGLSLIRP